MTVHLDRDATRVDVLVNAFGVDQITASRIVWAPELLTEPGPWEPMQVQRAWARERARQIVWAGLAPVLHWLGLHSDPMVVYRRAKAGDQA